MKRTILTLLTATAVTLAVAAGPEFSVEGVRLVGGDLGITLGDWKLVPGAGYEAPDFGRDTVTGDPIPGNQVKSRPFLNGELRLYRLWDLGEADLRAGAGVWSFGDGGSGSAAAGPVVDLNGNTFGFLQVGAMRDRRSRNSHGAVSGSRIEAFAEWGPAALSVRGTDYYKLSLQASQLVPLWDLEGPSQLFSGTLGFRADAQWIDGRSVPWPLLEPTEVRGYYRTLDSRFRSVVTSELRVGLPSLWGAHDLVPVLFTFAEGGWYAGYADASAAASDRTGWLASTGAGLGLSVWGLTTLTLTAGLPLTDGESGLWWKANFNLRF